MVRHFARWTWIALAYAFVALAILGVFLPGLPTTPFVLAAVWAAARGSQHLHDWLVAHRIFGPMIRDWREQGAVSRRAKHLSLLTMLLCAVIIIGVAPHWGIAAFACGWMTLVAVWLWLRPEPR